MDAPGLEPWGIEPRRPRPERRFDLYAGLAVTALGAAAYLAALVLDVVPPRGAAVAFFGAVPLSAGFALVLLVARARAERDLALSWFCAGLSVAWVAMVLQFVSFPLVARGGGALGTTVQSNAGLYLFFHVALASGALAGGLGASQRWQAPAVAVGVVVAFCLAVNVVPLPTLVAAGVRFTSVYSGAAYLLAALTAAAALVWVRRAGRSAPTLRGWVGVALSLSAYEVLLFALAAQRFSSVWWASLSLRAAAYLVLATGAALSVLRRLAETESYSTSELDRREGELRSTLAVTRLLLSAAEDLARAVTPAQVAFAVCEDAVAASGLRCACVVADRHGEGPVVLAVAPQGTELPRESGGVAWAWALPTTESVPVFLDTAATIRAHLGPGPLGALQEAACVAMVPIRAGREAVATLVVWDGPDRGLGAIEREVLVGLAAQGGQALRRAVAFERESRAADTLQRALLSSALPRRDDVALAARYVAGEQGTQVGGDWYDCISIDNDRVALVVGDVMGKGLPAAAVMGQVRTAVRSLASVDPAPAAVLSGLDRLTSLLGTDEIATVVYILVDVPAGVARIARAGHLPPVLVTPDGHAALVDAGGSPPLGSPVGERFEAQFPVPAGSVLVLYTDGMVEDRVTYLGGLDGFVAQVQQVVRDKGGAVEATATALVAGAVVDHREDDMALLVARFDGVVLAAAAAGSRSLEES